MRSSAEKFVVSWLGHANNRLAIHALPSGVDMVKLFPIHLQAVTGLSTAHVTSDGMTWGDIMSGVRSLQARGTKVLASIASMPGAELSWNTIANPVVTAAQIRSIVIEQWGLNGIDIHPELDGGAAPNQTFIDVVIELSKHLGPMSGTGTVMTYASHGLELDGPLLRQTAGVFNHVGLVSHARPFPTMLEQFHEYAKILGPAAVLFGISPRSPGTPLSDVSKLAQWEPQGARKGGMMELDVNGDAGFRYARAILQYMPRA